MKVAVSEMIKAATGVGTVADVAAVVVMVQALTVMEAAAVAMAQTLAALVVGTVLEAATIE